MAMDFSKLLSQIEQTTTKKSYDDESVGFWKPTKDKAGNASAVIHFLPSANIEDIPFVKTYSHSFKNPENGRWYIEKSLSTIGQPDYIGEVNSELWNTGIEENKEIARAHKRKLSYVSNIYVEKDIGNPENDGKVFKFRYGSKIFDKLKAAMNPEEGLGEAPINPWCPDEGAYFLLKMTKVSDFPNYDGSRFASKKPMFDGDQKKISSVLKECVDITEELDPKGFKSYEELKKRYMYTMGTAQAQAKKGKPEEDDDAEMESLAEQAKPAKKEPTKKSVPLPKMDAGDDDDDAFFKSLLE